ncbi:MAG TPA: Rieske 2Fe-2S domain-containing protein [Candidatus Binataceae bacterium]|nr:Rieske 2Fe-2S domain-containing protein [Candidatus Binataceae bacterium]
MTNETQQSGEALSPERRAFLGKLSMALAGIAAMFVAVPVVGFILGPLIKKTPQGWRNIGRLEEFIVGTTVKVNFRDPSPLAWAGVTAESAAWLRRTGDDTFIAFAMNCTHLGCPVRWLPSANLFMCPCHGGVYYNDGSVAAGPPPHPLSRYPVRVVNGIVQIRTSPVPIV